MKQKLLLLLVVLSFLLPARLAAYDFESGGIYYDITSDNEVCVTSSPGDNPYSGDIVIPSTVEYEGQTYPVTSIGGNAFNGCKSLTSIVIPNSVTSIKETAFYWCEALTSIEIPNSVTSIDNGAFFGCRSLSSIELPNSLRSLENDTFGYCNSLISIKIPASVTSIGGHVFMECHNLQIVIIQSKDMTFADNSFGGTIPWYAFAPKTLDCTALNFDVRTFDPETTVIMEDGTIFTDNSKTLFFVPVYEGMSYSIPDGVIKISAAAFCPMYGSRESKDFTKRIMTSLTIPSTIEEIEPDAFLNTKIEKVNFTDWSKWYANVKLGNLYSNPYWNSTPYVGGVQMLTPELADGITEIPDYKNYGLQFKGEIEIPRSIKRIGAYAFYNNKELFSVILPQGLEEIGECAFEGCELLENPAFPSGLKKIENGAYKGCTSITEIELPAGLTMLGEKESTVTASGEIKGVFEGCTALEKAVVAVDIDYLTDNLFKGCRALDKIYFPLQLKTIGNSAFEYCLTLDEITFPATLEYIGERAFNCQWADQWGHISKLIIPDGVTHIGVSAFAYQRIADISIGKGIESIPEYAFYYNPLQMISFSEGLKEIGAYAFGCHNNLTHIGSVILPSTVTTVADHAFEGTYISSLVIPDEVETLGPGSCGRPSTLTLGSYVKDIAADAFDFEKLYTIRLKAHMPPSLSDAFPLTEQQNDQLTLIVNKGRHDTYNTTARWKQIDRIIEEGDSEVDVYLDGTYSLAEEIRMQSGYMPSVITKMKVIGPLTDSDLRVIKENMVSLTDLDLSEVTNVTALPENQFAGSLLTTVVLPSNLETIGDGAFNECRLLKLTELPKTVKGIGNNAFSNCPEVNLNSLPEGLEYIGREAFAATGMREVVAGEFLSEIGDGAFKGCTLLERADLGAAAITGIADNVFSGCSELDEVILPSNVESIGQWAFSGTAIRNIDFASEVTTIGDNAFCNNRRLVSATLPETITRVGSNLFANCPRLISVSMPMSTTEVGENILQGDRKLANISCSAPEAPEAVTGALNDLRYRYVTLTVPTLSFRKYIAAPQWGKLECLKNTIRINKGKGVTLTSAAEKEYKDMLKEDELEAAQEAAAVQNGKISKARAMRRAAARAKTVENFATIFDGAQLMSGTESTANRVFITPEPGVNVTSILFDGEELLSSFDGYSILLPEGKSGTLEILTDAKAGAESIELSNTELTLTDGETATLKATVEPADVDNKTVIWTSSDESVAEVNEKGEVTAVGVGKVTISASCGDVSAECAVKCYPMLGDANWNGSVTITDAVDISNYVLMKKSAPADWDKAEWAEFYIAGANANASEDGKVTFADASATVNIVLSELDAAPAMSRIVAASKGTDILSDALVVASARMTADGRTAVAFKLDSSIEYVALQADIHLPVGMNVAVKAGSAAAGHFLETRSYDDKHLRLALYDYNNRAFAATGEPLFEIVADATLADLEGISLTNILAADSDAGEYKLTFRPEAQTGVEGVDADLLYDVYDMNGIMVKSGCSREEVKQLTPGIYILRSGSVTEKAVIR